MTGLSMAWRVPGAHWAVLNVCSGPVAAIVFVGVVSLFRYLLPSLGAAAYGVYAQAVSLGSILAILIDGGFGKLLMRETVRASSALDSHGERLHGYAFGHALAITGVLALLVMVNPLAKHRPTLLASVGAFAAIVLVNFSIAVLRGHGRLMRDALWQIGCRLLTAFFMVVVLWRGADAPWMILTAQCLDRVVFVGADAAGLGRSVVSCTAYGLRRRSSSDLAGFGDRGLFPRGHAVV
jgi:O-antigen/teichoic acid export membrane protein